MTKVAVAMSGGVDSSVTAALCVKEYGAENVFGLTMRLFCYNETDVTDDKSCCSTDAVNDAKKVCEQLGIEHYVVNMEKEFEKEVISDFIAEYQAGRTPNPCIKCNQVIKFENLLKKAMGLGANLLVTGHYARVGRKNGTFELLKGTDANKDQSYFLYNLNQDQLSAVIFPLGGFNKTETRKLATELNLKTAEKTESQNICFVSGRLENYLSGKISLEKGDIVTTDGEVIGEHEGIGLYTIGQRKGLGGGTKEPMYVIGIDGLRNLVIVGKEKELYRDGVGLAEIHWISGKEPYLPLKCTAKIRYNMEEAECTIHDSENSNQGSKPSNLSENYIVKFKEPQRAVTPGQSIVFYNKDEVLGGGIISASL